MIQAAGNGDAPKPAAFFSVFSEGLTLQVWNSQAFTSEHLF